MPVLIHVLAAIIFIVVFIVLPRLGNPPGVLFQRHLTNLDSAPFSHPLPRMD